MSALMTGLFAAVGITAPLPQGSLARLHHDQAITGIVFAPNNQTVYTASGKVVREWDVIRGQTRRTFTHPDLIASLALTPNGHYLAAGGYANGREDHFPSLVIWEVSSGRRIHQFASKSHEANINSLAFSANGKWLAWAEGDEKAAPRLLRLSADREEASLAAERIGVTLVAFTPDSKVLITVDHRMVIRCWDLATQEEVKAIHSARSAPRLFRSDRHGVLFATLDNLGVYRLWDWKSHRVIDERPWLRGAPLAMTFAPDSKTLALGGEDGSVRLWNTWAGESRHEFIGHRKAVTELAFSPDGSLLASGGVEGVLILWQVDRRGWNDKRLSSASFSKYWDVLASEKFDESCQAILKLAESPNRTVPLLDDRLRMMPLPSRGQMQRWIEDLDHRRYLVRANAQEALKDWGPRSEPALRELVSQKPTLEVRRRAEEVLETIAARQHHRNLARMQRVVELLELIDTPAARELLARLANEEFPEAIVALKRLPRANPR